MSSDHSTRILLIANQLRATFSRSSLIRAGAVLLWVSFLVPTFGRPLTAAASSSIIVVFLPATGLPANPSSDKPSVLSVKAVSKDLLGNLMEQLEDPDSLYTLCLYDPAATANTTCNPTTAAVIVRTAFTADPSADPKTPSYSVTMTSIDIVNGRVIGSVTFDKKVTYDATTVTAANADEKFTAAFQVILGALDKVEPLFGAPIIVGNTLALSPGYEPYLQLVPTLIQADDPSYVPYMTNLLARRGLTAVQSQFNAGVVASNTTPINTICGRGQRYFVYSVSTDQSNVAMGFGARLETHATGQLFDCATMTVTPVGVDQHQTVLTVSGPAAQLVQLLQVVFISKTNSWANVGTAFGLAAPFFDRDAPNSTPVKNHIAERALQGLVDNLCTALDKPTPPPLPANPPLTADQLAAEAAAIAQAQADLDTAIRKLADIENAFSGQYEELQKQVSALTGQVQRIQAMIAGVTSAQDLASRMKNLAQAKADLAAAITKLQQLETQFPIAIQPSGKKVIDTLRRVQVLQATAVTASQNPDTNAPSTATAATLTSLDVGGFLAAAPPPLTCHAPVLDRSKYIAPPDNQRWTYNLHGAPAETQTPPPATPYPAVEPLFHSNNSE